MWYQKPLWGLGESGLVWQSGEKKPFYEISDKGRDYLESPREEIEGEEHKQSAEVKRRQYCEKWCGGNERYRPHPG